jgi:hypothetical protein
VCVAAGAEAVRCVPGGSPAPVPTAPTESQGRHAPTADPTGCLPPLLPHAHVSHSAPLTLLSLPLPLSHGKSTTWLSSAMIEVMMNCATDQCLFVCKTIKSL